MKNASFILDQLVFVLVLVKVETCLPVVRITNNIHTRFLIYAVLTITRRVSPIKLSPNICIILLVNDGGILFIRNVKKCCFAKNPDGSTFLIV